MRKFEKISTMKDGIIPKRSTKYSAGYDFYLIENIILKPNETYLCKTGIKVQMNHDEYLAIHIRSSLAIKNGIILTNSTGIIDSDYYNNSNNEGHILISIINTSKNIIKLKKGERFAQGIFNKYYLCNNDNIENIRNGGIGSTKK